MLVSREWGIWLGSAQHLQILALTLHSGHTFRLQIQSPLVLPHLMIKPLCSPQYSHQALFFPIRHGASARNFAIAPAGESLQPVFLSLRCGNTDFVYYFSCYKA